MTAATTLRHGYTSGRYGQLHYLEALPGVAGDPLTPLVLLHQNPSSSEEYRSLAVALGADRRVIALDTPGSGMSDWPPAPCPIADLALALADGLEGLGFDDRSPVDVFGFHTGTLLAGELALQRPGVVRRLVLSGIPLRSDEERLQRLQAARDTPPLTDDGADVLERFAALWRYVVTDRDARVPLERAAALFTEKAKSMHRFWWPYEAVWTYSIADRFPGIRQPVLILQPHENLLQQSLRAARLLRQVEVVELAGLSRDVFEVGIEEISREMRRFLAH